MGKYAPQAAGEGGKVAMRCRRDLEAGGVISTKSSKGKIGAHREGNARGELRRAVALSNVCKM